MLAFHGDFKLKGEILKRLQAHSDADQIIKGQYWQHGKGCAVGCTIHSGRGNYEPILGIPSLIEGLEDNIFEGLDNKSSKEFPIPFIQAVPVGADLSKVFYKWSIRMLLRIRPLALRDGQEAIDQIIELFKKSPEEITEVEATEAAEAARAATWTAEAARAVTRAATWAAEAAGAVARAATWAAEAAGAVTEATGAARVAGAATRATDEAVAEAAAPAEREKQKDDLLELLKESGLLNIKESASYLGMKDKTFRNILNYSRYEPLKTKKVIISGKTFFNVEDLLRVKKN